MLKFSDYQIFVLFFIIGLIIGLLFDFFRAIRKVFKTNDLITFLEDLLFLFFSGTIVIYSIIKISGGNIRFYVFISIFLGIYIYSLTISNFCVIILYVLVKLCKKILFFPILCIIKSINYLGKYFNRKKISGEILKK